MVFKHRWTDRSRILRCELELLCGPNLLLEISLIQVSCFYVHQCQSSSYRDHRYRGANVLLGIIVSCMATMMVGIRFRVML
jgi:hypothetical protein